MEQKFEYFASGRHKFLEQEFGACFREINENFNEEVENSNSKIFVCVGNSVEEIELLKTLDTNRVIAFLYADEIYNLKLNVSILRTKSIMLVARSYPLWKFEIKSIINWLIQINEIRKYSGFNFSLIKDLLAGITIMLKQTIIKILEFFYHKKSFYIPLGYTNLFYDSFIALRKEINEQGSLFNSEIQIRELYRNFAINFIGQRGNTERRSAVKILSEYDNTKLIIRERFGGTLNSYEASALTGSEFAHTLLQSKFTLCPSGNYSALSFRYMESLICGSIPLQKSNPITDPLFKNQKVSDKIPNLLWTKIIKAANDMSESERFQILEAEIERQRSHTESIKLKILELMKV